MSDWYKIPPMTDPLGEYWVQPKLDQILVDDKTAVMKRDAFDMLHEYSFSIPNGTYAGKMWKLFNGKDWHLAWYENMPNDTSKMAIKYRVIEILHG